MNKNDKKALIATLVANDAIMLPEDKLNELGDEALLNFGKLIKNEKSEAEIKAQKKLDAEKKEPELSKESILNLLGITEETLNAVITRTTQSVQNDEASKTAVIKELIDSKTLGLSEDQLKELPIPVLNEFKMFSSTMNFAMRTQRREDQSIPEMPKILTAKPKKEGE